MPTDEELLANSFGATKSVTSDEAILAKSFSNNEPVASDQQTLAASFGAQAPQVPPPSKLTQFEYGFQKSETIYQNAKDWLTAHAPVSVLEISNTISKPLNYLIEKSPGLQYNLPGLFNSSLLPSNEYGQDFSQLTPEQRLERIHQVRATKLAKQFPEMQGVQPTLTTGAGEIAGSLVKDPFTYFPVGGAVGAGEKTLWGFMKSVAPLGAAYGGGFEALHQLAYENQIHLLPIGEAALGGAVIAPVIPWGLSKAGSAVSRAVNKSLTKNANVLVDDVQNSLIAKMSENKPRMQALQEVLQEKNMTMPELSNAMTRADRSTASLFIPPDANAAQQIMVNAEPVGWRTWKSGSWIDDFVEPISSRIGKISAAVKLRLNKMEMNIHSRTYKLERPGDALFDHVATMSKDNQALFKRAWLSRDMNTIERMIEDNPIAKDSFKAIRGILNDLHNEYSSTVDNKLTYLTDYLPRLVADYDTMRAAMGREPRNALDTLLAEAGRKKGGELTELEKLDIIGKWMRGYPRDVARAPFRKARQLGDVLPQELIDTYASPKDSYHAYLRRSILDIEKAKFFGSKSLKLNPLNRTVDSDASIANFIANDPELIKNADKLNELRQLLKARFDAGESSPRKTISNIRNLTYMATIGNPFSAITQAQDIAFSAAHIGMWDLLRAIGRSSLKDITSAVFGLRKASEELAESNISSARVLDKILKLVQFERVDQLGKTLNLRANFQKFTRLSKSEKGVQKIAKKYQAAYGDDFASLVDDLKNRRMSENVKLLLWSELTEIQPISKSEMPLKYLQNPNGRLFYALQSFTLKQLDYVRRNIYGQFVRGEIKEGSANLARFAAFLGAAGVGVTALKNWILGRPMNADDYKDASIVAFWKNFGASPIVIYKILSAGQKKQTLHGKLSAKGQAFLRESQTGLGMPILDLVTTAGIDLFKMFDEQDPYAFNLTEKIQSHKSFRYVPIVGPFLYNFFGGGLEQWNKAEERKRLSKYGF